MSMTKLLTQNDVCVMLGITEGELEKLITNKRFPPPLSLGLRRKVWIGLDVRKFTERVEALRGEQLISGSAAKTETTESLVLTEEAK